MCTSTIVEAQLATGMLIWADYPATYDSNNEISSTGCKFAKITDGLSNTIAFSEVMHHREDYANNPNQIVPAGANDSIFHTRQRVSQA